jgi:hypothetical protein
MGAASLSSNPAESLGAAGEVAGAESARPQPGPTLHIVVTCMGRREMIRQTIELALAQPSSTYTLVDYSCPQHTGEWVRDNYPKANVVFVKGRTSWHASEARNLGARTIQDGLICFLDSDILLPPDFSVKVMSTIMPNTFLTIDSFDSSVFGLIVCRQEDFVRCGGYDEIIRDWGGEDLDLRRSLTRVGLEMARLPSGAVDAIPHDNAVRTQNCGIKDRYASNHVNAFYSFVKDVLLTEGDTLATEQLLSFYNFGRDRLLLGMPWLSWPDGDIEPSDFPRLLRHIFAASKGYCSMEPETWGPVHLFRVQRDGDSMTEILSIHNSHRIGLRAPGHATFDVVSIYGDKTPVPVHQGECSVLIKAEPIFLPAGVSLIKDVSILLGPAPGPALAVELAPGPDYDGRALRLSVSVDGEAMSACDVPSIDSPKRLRIPVSSASPEQPTIAEATLTGGARTQVVARRTTFLTAPAVKHEEALQAIVPERIYRYTIGEAQTSPVDQPSPVEALRAEVAWGWTETDLVCWITRQHVPGVETSITIAIDAENIKSTHIEPLEIRVHRDDRPDADGIALGPDREWRTDYQTLFDVPTIRLAGALTTEFSSPCLRMAIRIPLDVIGVPPTAGRTLGLALFIVQIDGEGVMRSLAWGAGMGIGPYRNPRLYNEITLTN